MAPRTKACALCRKKRIKCDATLPNCLMCIRTGKQCPGPLDGPLIIDMSNPGPKRRKRRKNEVPIGPLSPSSSSLPPIHLHQHDSQNPSIFLDRYVYTPTPRSHIDQSALITEAFFANFLSYFTSTGESLDLQYRTTWTHRLPQLSTRPSAPALGLALRATATAFCGVDQNNNPAVLQHALHLYGQALQAHSKTLQSMQHHQRKRDQNVRTQTWREAEMMQQASDHPCIDQPNDHPYTLEMISTSVLLSIFEAMQSTTPTAYHAHVDGAVRMIEHTGPGECYQGALCQLFFHVRTQMAFVNLTTRTCLKVQMHRILVEHLEYTRLPIFQQLMDHIGILAEAYVQGDGSEESSRSTSSHTESSPKMPEPAYLDVKAGIERLYTEYTTQAAERGEVLISHPFLPLPPSPIGTKAPTGIYRDPFTALTLSYFSATRILLSLLSPPSQSPSTASAFPAEPKDTLHFSQILSAASYLAISRIGFTYMRMAVPLFLVAAHSPDPVQRREARAVFEEWGRGNMRGISALALQRLGKEEKKGKEQEEGEGEGEGRDVGRKEPKEKENEEEGTKEPHVCRELRDLFRTVSAGGQTGAGITL